MGTLNSVPSLEQVYLHHLFLVSHINPLGIALKAFSDRFFCKCFTTARITIATFVSLWSILFSHFVTLSFFFCLSKAHLAFAKIRYKTPAHNQHIEPYKQQALSIVTFRLPFSFLKSVKRMRLCELAVFLSVLVTAHALTLNPTYWTARSA